MERPDLFPVLLLEAGVSYSEFKEISLRRAFYLIEKKGELEKLRTDTLNASSGTSDW